METAVIPREVAEAQNKTQPQPKIKPRPQAASKTEAKPREISGQERTASKFQRLREIGQKREALTQQHGREPTIDEIARALGVKKEALMDDLEAIKAALSQQEEVPEAETKKRLLEKPKIASGVETEEELGTDTFRLFLREMENHPRLSPEEQDQLSHELSDQRQIMNSLKEKRDAKRTEGKPDPKIEAEFEVEKLRYRETRGRIVEANLRLVVFLANKHRDRGVPLMELIAEGSEALVIAADRYDYYHPQKTQFVTFAYEKIEGMLKHAIAKNSPYFHSIHSRFREITATRDRITQEKGEPTIEELAEALGMNPGTLERGLSRPKEHLSLEEILESEDMHSKSALERAIGVDGVADEAVRRAFTSQLGSVITRVLSPKEVEVIMKRFGKEQAQEETGEDLGKTKNTVAGMERKALRKLREDPEIQKLHEALEEGEPKRKKTTKTSHGEIHEEPQADTELTVEEQFARELEKRMRVILKPIELDVLKRRFGVEGEREDNIQIGEEVDRRVDEISKIAQRGIRKLKGSQEGQEILEQLKSFKPKPKTKATTTKQIEEPQVNPELTPEEQFASDLERKMKAILRSIELEVLKRRFGLRGEKEKNARIAEEVHRHPEQVSDIAQRGIRKLKGSQEGQEILEQLKSLKAS